MLIHLLPLPTESSGSEQVATQGKAVTRLVVGECNDLKDPQRWKDLRVLTARGGGSGGCFLQECMLFVLFHTQLSCCFCGFCR